MFHISPSEYQSRKPYPYTYQDNFLEKNEAEKIQEEILNLDSSAFSRYNNPFEKKSFLKDKENLPPHLTKLYDYLTSEPFVQHLSVLVGIPLMNDTLKHYNGIHMFENGDKLNIHVDAGIHPFLNKKKQVTFGLYLSKNWKPEYNGNFEVWEGTNASENDATLIRKSDEIEPIFNRAVIFTCDDYSWHGCPVEISSPSDAKRIFLTLSYLSNDTTQLNKRTRAFFVPIDKEKETPEEFELRFKRQSEHFVSSIYRINNPNSETTPKTL